MRTMCLVDRYVIARENNVVRVDFDREPDPPAPQFNAGEGVANAASPCRANEVLRRFVPAHR
jgi:hypothetical protein